MKPKNSRPELAGLAAEITTPYIHKVDELIRLAFDKQTLNLG